MVLNKREKNIGIGAIAALVLLAVNSFVINPYFEKLKAIDDEMEIAGKSLSDAQALMGKQARLQKVYKQMEDGGLLRDQSHAQNQASSGLSEWAREAGIEPNFPAASTTQDGPFMITKTNVTFTVTGNDSMRSLSRMLWALESTRIPIRLNDMSINAVHEGTDQLSVKLDVSVLYTPQGFGGGSTSPGGQL
jgi:hypothetical protein